MLIQHSTQKSVIVVDVPPANNDIIFRHRVSSRVVPEQSLTVPKSRLTPKQAMVAIFYDKAQHVVHTHVLREERKWISGIGYQLGCYAPFHAGRIHSAEAGGVALTFRKVMVCDTHYLRVKLIPFLLLSQPQAHVQPSHHLSAQADVASEVMQ